MNDDDLTTTEMTVGPATRRADPTGLAAAKIPLNWGTAIVWLEGGVVSHVLVNADGPREKEREALTTLYGKPPESIELEEVRRPDGDLVASLDADGGESLVLEKGGSPAGCSVRGSCTLERGAILAMIFPCVYTPSPARSAGEHAALGRMRNLPPLACGFVAPNWHSHVGATQ